MSVTHSDRTGRVGKSRLGLEVAWHKEPAMVDGVWLVELAPVVDPRLVGAVVAGRLGVAEGAVDC